MSGGWLGGWIIWKYKQLSPQLGWVGACAELGKKRSKTSSRMAAKKKADMVRDKISSRIASRKKADIVKDKTPSRIASRNQYDIK